MRIRTISTALSPYLSVMMIMFFSQFTHLFQPFLFTSGVHLLSGRSFHQRSVTRKGAIRVVCGLRKRDSTTAAVLLCDTPPTSPSPTPAQTVVFSKEIPLHGCPGDGYPWLLPSISSPFHILTTCCRYRHLAHTMPRVNTTIDDVSPLIVYSPPEAWLVGNVTLDSEGRKCVLLFALVSAH